MAGTRAQRHERSAQDDTLLRQAYMAQAFSVLSKPISRQQLTITVEAALRRIYGWGNPLDESDEHYTGH